MSEDKRIILSVTQLTGEIKRVLENSFPRLWVQGEISNLTVHSSGHLYFSLKDAGSQVRCVMFRSYAQNMMLMPQDGMQVVVQGDVTVFDRAGQYQLSVQQLQVAGYGELAQAFERLKKKLADEGLFDQEFKKELPAYPKTIGIVTSPTGAAIRDMVKVARRRWPGIELILCPVPVQGIGAAQKIARAVDDLNEYQKIDLIIVGRGGGSAEDLWAFNEEILARAIFHSNIPVISAVGHEVDFTISDLVADLRAPTPSAAAEMAVPDVREVQSNLIDSARRIASSMNDLLDEAGSRLKSIQRSYGLNRLQDMLSQKSQQLDWAGTSLNNKINDRLSSYTNRLQGQAIALKALDPKNTLKRGYSICRDQNGRVVVSAKALDKGKLITAEFHTGKAQMTVEETIP
ncbi:MAG: exodeoxyribonuclease VII large subunit [Candidatus Edwardsbacteria bacterium]|nr:exodeoxyribonuclease VII large subunit [Candidatus Edwardsbacteria bacterium]MBU1577737.1 exodeoxyribonuclease VII large subunit [Candidatus Edwardsbacteria bacterium]MBU2464259.1 exodeoxyribonuclease VII large subunit [Candidatus Edwardsbacteria bacterium]MBU2593509.1 exodeoxyribonuclease VII large subunit [Candidatus Edwardsbacteria bacterium]